MDSIRLRNLTFYGYHGVLDEERRLGQRFIVDTTLRLDLRAAGRQDDLHQTVNYAEVTQVIRAVVEGPPFKLIEALAEQIASTVLERFEPVRSISVRVGKPSAPISDVPTATVSVEIERRRDAEPTAWPSGSVLAANSIRALLDTDLPLVSHVSEPDEQIQPNGVDLTLESVWTVAGAGVLGRTNAERVIPERLPVDADADGWYNLTPGPYIIRLAETVALPLNVMAFGRPRSSLLRCGAALHTAVWDAGYRGRSESLMVVYEPGGIRLRRGTRVLQLVFVQLDGMTHPYGGRYQGENIPSG